MIVVITLFVLTNISYFSALSFDEITQSRTLAMVYMPTTSHFRRPLPQLKVNTYQVALWDRPSASTS